MTLPDITVQLLAERDDAPARLGRHVEHDPRSLAYAYPEPSRRQPGPVLWPRYSPVLDQGQLGSCTGNAMVGWLGCAPHCRSVDIGATYDEDLAVKVYELATRLDRFPGQFPPDDTGSSGLAVAKAARRMGYLGSYSWAFTLAGLLNALQHQPVIVGIPWYDDMFTPDGSGEVHVGGEVAGGHEVLIRGWDGHYLLCDNSWGAGWGIAGGFKLSLTTWSVLRRQGADVTVPHV